MTTGDSLKAKKFSNVLAIETSCDDTSVAIVESSGRVRRVIAAHQNAAHEAFGGIVPEIASRNHTHHLLPLIDRCLSDAQMSLHEVDAIAVTSQPGLVGALMVGVVTAKSLALALNKPLIGVNHLEGHLLAPFLRDDEYAPADEFDFPFVALAVSGGHTSLYWVRGLGDYEILGATLDDAAGEAFDKFGKMVGLGFPGGVWVDRWAAFGNPAKFQFPRPMLKEAHLHFSFSGMKTAAARILESFGDSERETLARESCNRASPSAGLLADLCASFQEACVDILLDRAQQAVQARGAKRVVVTGGVSANSRLRARAQEWAARDHLVLAIPPLRYCTDNAAMIGYAGIQRLNRGESSPLNLGAEARAPLAVAPLPDNLPEWLKRARR